MEIIGLHGGSVRLYGQYCLVASCRLLGYMVESAGLHGGEC